MKFLQLSGEDEILSSPNLEFFPPSERTFKCPCLHRCHPHNKIGFEIIQTKKNPHENPTQQDDHPHFGREHFSLLSGILAGCRVSLQFLSKEQVGLSAPSSRRLSHGQGLPWVEEVPERTTGAGSTAQCSTLAGDTTRHMMKKGEMGATHRLPVGVVHRRDNATDDDEAPSLVQVIPGSL